MRVLLFGRGGDATSQDRATDVPRRLLHIRLVTGVTLPGNTVFTGLLCHRSLTRDRIFRLLTSVVEKVERALGHPRAVPRKRPGQKPDMPAPRRIVERDEFRYRVA
jgi:hypothetical protein